MKFRFSSYFLLIIILITEKFFVEAKFVCVMLQGNSVHIGAMKSTIDIER